MKYFISMLGLWLLGVANAAAQSVTVEVVLDQQYYLPHEALIAKVRITNFSGQTLRFGEEEDWLTFLVEGQNNTIARRLGPVPVKGEFTLESSEVGTKRVDLAPYYDISTPGRYTLMASVKIPQWQGVIRSPAQSFDIIRGNKVWERSFGVPRPDSQAEQAPEVRKYALVQANHLQQTMVYMRLSDGADNKVFRVFPVAPMVSFSKLEPHIDRYSNFHVLIQTGARSFTYAVINPDGLIIARETYQFTDTRPALRVGEDGRVSVKGGARRISPTDLPPPPTTVDTRELQPE